MTLTMLAAFYAMTVVWRVSDAEERYLGRSDLIPFSSKRRKFNQAATAKSFGEKTYDFQSPLGARITVWKQKINGFQHLYGSALTCRELGASASTLLFCLNEYADAGLDSTSKQPREILERKKDLANNALGRILAAESRSSSATGGTERRHDLAYVCAKAVETDERFLASCLDPRLKSIDEKDLGCNCLTDSNSIYLTPRHDNK